MSTKAKDNAFLRLHATTPNKFSWMDALERDVCATIGISDLSELGDDDGLRELIPMRYPHDVPALNVLMDIRAARLFRNAGKIDQAMEYAARAAFAAARDLRIPRMYSEAERNRQADANAEEIAFVIDAARAIWAKCPDERLADVAELIRIKGVRRGFNRKTTTPIIKWLKGANAAGRIAIPPNAFAKGRKPKRPYRNAPRGG